MTDAESTPTVQPPERTLCGPGPSEVHPRVLEAMRQPLVGHLDAAFLEIMDEVQQLLREVFQTDNRFTLPISGTGSAAMETAIANLVEPGDTMLVPTNGYFGDRMAQMATRAGGDVVTVDAPWGGALDPDDVNEALARHDVDVFGFVHAETSTGVLQPDVPELTAAAHDHGALVIADTVTSIGGVELRVDAWDIDVAYAGAQKCLSCPPGASPLTMNDRALEKVRNRDDPVRTWYLDASLLDGYWGEDRAYHHTAPISNVYALCEALRLVDEEGLEARWARHERMSNAFAAGLEALGAGLYPDPSCQLPSLLAVTLPEGVRDDAVIGHMLDEDGIEIASGLGDLAGDIVRIGCMGHSARPPVMRRLLDSFARALEAAGGDIDAEAGRLALEDHLDD